MDAETVVPKCVALRTWIGEVQYWRLGEDTGAKVRSGSESVARRIIRERTGRRQDSTQYPRDSKREEKLQTF